MLEILPESQANILGVKAGGKLISRELQEVLVPRLKAIIQAHGRVRLLFSLDEDVPGVGPGGVAAGRFRSATTKGLSEGCGGGGLLAGQPADETPHATHQWRGAEFFPG